MKPGDQVTFHYRYTRVGVIRKLYDRHLVLQGGLTIGFRRVIAVNGKLLIRD